MVCTPMVCKMMNFFDKFFDEIFVKVFDEFFIFKPRRALGSEYLRSCFINNNSQRRESVIEKNYL